MSAAVEEAQNSNVNPEQGKKHSLLTFNVTCLVSLYKRHRNS